MKDALILTLTITNFKNEKIFQETVTLSDNKDKKLLTKGLEILMFKTLQFFNL
jgi:hypothetical protein